MKAVPVNKYTATFASVLFENMLSSVVASAQEPIFSTGPETSAPGLLVLFPNLGTGLGDRTPIHVVPSQPDPINPHGFGFLGPTTVVAGKIDGYHSSDIRVDIIDLSHAKFRLFSSSNFSKSTTGD